MQIKPLLKSLGPGLIWAGAAVGVSHLVQSTRAGALYGFELIWVIVIINIFKYPFFEFGPRYSSITGRTLLDGYFSLGKWAVNLYLFATLTTMFAIQATVTMVTASLFSNLFPGMMSVTAWSGVLLILLSVFIMTGKYKVLDKLMKFIIIILSLTTIIAVISSLKMGYNPDPALAANFEWKFEDVAFLIALAGWMPSTIDISVWHSFWTIARKNETGHAPSLKEALFDFNLGYIGTFVLAICFLALGALVMYGTGMTFSSSGAVFAGQLISLYTESIGSWAYYIISIAAIATMFSTAITCLDAYPRVLKSASEMIIPKLESPKEFNSVSFFWLVLTAVGAFIIIRYFSSDLKMMVDVVTTLSFTTAPIIAWLNYRVVMSDTMPVEGRPKKWLQVLSIVGIIGLTAFGIVYLIYRYFI